MGNLFYYIFFIYHLFKPSIAHDLLFPPFSFHAQVTRNLHVWNQAILKKHSTRLTATASISSVGYVSKRCPPLSPPTPAGRWKRACTQWTPYSNRRSDEVVSLNPRYACVSFFFLFKSTVLAKYRRWKQLPYPFYTLAPAQLFYRCFMNSTNLLWTIKREDKCYILLWMS